MSSRYRSKLGLVALLMSVSIVCAKAQVAVPWSIVLDRKTTVFLPQGEPAPVVHAAEDLVGDLIKVFGPGPHLVYGDPRDATIQIGSAHLTRPGERVAGAESFSIATSTARQPHRAVELAGADMRGTIYSIYQFSQEFLGIDPMYYWTDHEPVHRETIAVPPGLRKQYPAPVFQFRGFFINDEDLLTAWASGEEHDHTGISLEVWNRIFETILRLKGNMVVPGTFPFSGEPQELAAAGRGLILHQHHAEPLGVDVARWPKNIPYSFTAQPQFIRNAWEHSVAAIPAGQETLWTVGLRGLSDQSYAALDPSVKDDPAAQGRLISKAIAEEVGLVRAVQPDAVFATNVWSEGAQLLEGGYLQLPPGVIAIWPDTGYGDLQDHGHVQKGQGAYVHVAMMNRRANQLTEMVRPAKLFAELGRYQQAGATAYLLLNTSDIRPVTMGTRAVMDFAWKGSATGSETDFFHGWAAEEFGPAAAEELTGIYNDYFAAPALRSDAPLPVGDQYYHTQARDMILPTMVQYPIRSIPGQQPTWKEPALYKGIGVPGGPLANARAEIVRTTEAAPRWDRLWERAQRAEALADPARRLFYGEQVLTMVAIQRESNRMLLAVSRAVLALHDGDRAAALMQLQDATAALDRLRTQEKTSEYGKWRDWYAGDWLTDVGETKSLVDTFAAWIKDPKTPLPPPVVVPQWQAYYHILHYQGDREVDVH